MGISVNSDYNRYDYEQQQNQTEEVQKEEQQQEESIFDIVKEEFEEIKEGFGEIKNIFSGAIESLVANYNAYIDAQEDGFEEDTDKDVSPFKDGVTTDSNGEAKVTVEKWTGDSSENSSLFGIIRNHYDIDAVRDQNPELKDYSDEDMRFYIADLIAKENGIDDINVIETGAELTLPNIFAPKEIKDDTNNTDSTDNTTSDDTVSVDGETFLNKLKQAGGDAWNEFDKLCSTLGLNQGAAADYITKLCSETGDNCIDPVVFTALLRQESGFNEGAVGDGGLAIGLGQLQPVAVEQLNQWYPDKNYSDSDRYDAYKNLEMTMMFLKGHYNEYVNAYGTKPSVETLLGAYNQGWITLADNSGGRQYVKEVMSRLNSYSI